MNRKNLKNVDLTSRAMTIFEGNTGSGKTYLAEQLLSQYKNTFKNRVYLISNTASLQNIFPSIPKRRRFDTFDIKIIAKIVEHQKKMKEKGKMERVLIILDDCVGMLTVKQKRYLERLSTSGRHYGLCIWCLLQYVKVLPPVVRLNSYWIIFRCSSDELEVLWSIVPSCCKFVSKGEFISHTKKMISKPYSFVYISPFGFTHKECYLPFS